MGEIRTTNLRLNLEKPIQRQAWEYLQTMDKAVFKSYSQAIATALVDYFERYYKKQETPIWKPVPGKNGLSSRS